MRKKSQPPWSPNPIPVGIAVALCLILVVILTFKIAWVLSAFFDGVAQKIIGQ